jgi:hypothetical protein
VQGVKNEEGEVGLERKFVHSYAVKRHTAPETVTQLITGGVLKLEEGRLKTGADLLGAYSHVLYL